MRVAVIGIGLMGRAIAERLAACGHRVVVYNRTAEKTAPLAQMGLDVAPTPAHALERVSCAVLMLSDAAAIRAVLLDDATRASLRGRTIIQMGTIAPAESRSLSREVLAGGGVYGEAPVLGSLAEVREGRLLVLVGADSAQFESWKPLLADLGSALCLVGPVGQAAALKLALNQLIASHIAAFSLSVAYLQHAGVPLELFRTVLGQSALSAPMFEKKYPRLAARQYDNPNFSVRHLLKDVELFRREAEDTGLDGRALAGISGLLRKTMELGRSDQDYAAIFEAIDPLDPSIPPKPGG